MYYSMFVRCARKCEFRPRLDSPPRISTASWLFTRPLLTEQTPTDFSRLVHPSIAQPQSPFRPSRSREIRRPIRSCHNFWHSSPVSLPFPSASVEFIFVFSRQSIRRSERQKIRTLVNQKIRTSVDQNIRTSVDHRSSFSRFCSLPLLFS
ncbi:hypothetical protein EJF18_70138 [Clavispora lusitaniae]|uniref:Uncharacterized protein n=1 Tax=Clavispora lusitaniae TaxID=36911 RepID=A0ACD0WRQ0_CLALS|nr:hypothetical protein EJF14_70138 [Clavispora lusitaniae]QFZ35735.1 hypothetical protein EJF16_70138 [Clavispora lusitaniae]QFZ41417.1 hypothetical protein EJF15_70138 [Clavispora lusitaniae]QFZ47095.1 hypothetical protein EJF18_70138 [Clavispora lusitaniae]QFZ52772.1 hypothetical protein EJF17_70138 [Clavispora lusitaniae]